MLTKNQKLEIDEASRQSDYKLLRHEIDEAITALEHFNEGMQNKMNQPLPHQVEIDQREEIKEQLKSLRLEREAVKELFHACNDVVCHYVKLVDSGDAGNWNPNDEAPIKRARAAMLAIQLFH